jgi:hypothetical protein
MFNSPAKQFPLDPGLDAVPPGAPTRPPLQAREYNMQG